MTLQETNWEERENPGPPEPSEEEQHSEEKRKLGSPPQSPLCELRVSKPCVPVSAGPWEWGIGSWGLGQDTWDRTSSNPTLECDTCHLASSLCSTMEQDTSPSPGGESQSSEVRGGKRRGRTGVTSSPDEATPIQA